MFLLHVLTCRLRLVLQGLLRLCPTNIISSRYLSQRSKIRETRPVSRATQRFETNPELWPLNQPIPKAEALIQCAGETKYSDDLPTQPHEVYAAFVLATVARGDIVTIDASKALQQPGVIAFYDAKDIPGLNSFMPIYPTFYIKDEEVLCSKTVECYNQPYGIVVAETRHIAEIAAKLVTATYKNIKPPVIDVKKAINDPSRVILNDTINATDRGTKIDIIIEGKATIYGQYHFAMENIACVTKPTEEGLEVFATSQWIDAVQEMISKALNLKENQIDVYVRRLGGAFGIKITRSIRVAVACSLVTMKLNRPCRFVVPLTITTATVGKRLSCHTDYVCSVDSSGIIQYIDYKLYQDHGFVKTEDFTIQVKDGAYYNCYNGSRWNFKIFDTFTDKAKNTWCRSPGTLESVAMAENVIERISYELSLDTFDVRIANVDTTESGDLLEMAETLKSSARYDERKQQVNKFNKNSRWRKRGLKCTFVRWRSFQNLILYVNLAVFHSDGTVVITHGGVEMGQGINTKALQVAAYYLKIPMSYIQIKVHNTINAPNCLNTVGSLGSQDVTVGVRRCCEKLLTRLQPIRSQMINPAWEELIIHAYNSDINLQVQDYVGAKDGQPYDIFGVALAETEVDILTGEHQILRVDIIQDVGQSVSPIIDVGQVEGAFIMGVGYWTSERLVYDENTGELLTNRTWNYYVPLATDIPQDFRISFRKKSFGFPQFLGAKATGEPPLCLSVALAFALRAAIAEAREDSGIPKSNWFDIDGPFTVEKIALTSRSNFKDYKLY